MHNKFAINASSTFQFHFASRPHAQSHSIAFDNPSELDKPLPGSSKRKDRTVRPFDLGEDLLPGLL
jgi:hypothetical protein